MITRRVLRSGTEGALHQEGVGRAVGVASGVGGEATVLAPVVAVVDLPDRGGEETRGPEAGVQPADDVVALLHPDTDAVVDEVHHTLGLHPASVDTLAQDEEDPTLPPLHPLDHLEDPLVLTVLVVAVAQDPGHQVVAKVRVPATEVGILKQ